MNGDNIGLDGHSDGALVETDVVEPDAAGLIQPGCQNGRGIELAKDCLECLINEHSANALYTKGRNICDESLFDFLQCVAFLN